MNATEAQVNSLLAALTHGASKPWHRELELVEFPLGTVLYEPHAVPRDVYFPVSAVVSLVHVLADGNTAETAVIGCEGIVGVSAIMGDGSTPTRAVVQCAGTAVRLNAVVFKQQFMDDGQVARQLLQFAQALMAQTSQTAVCNRHHSIEQHLCRWILMMLDRHAGNEIAMTHELIAAMLGVRRESVSQAAAKLQKEGIINYWRGQIVVVDRCAVEQRACECYAVVKSEYARLLPALKKSAQTSGPPSMRLDAQRIAFLHTIGILDTPPEKGYDEIAQQVARTLSAPIAMVSFLDEQRDWFKACVGFQARESPAETSFCEMFFATTENTVIVENTQIHSRFASHPYVRGVPFIRSYAAARLIVGGHTVGTLCAFDFRERRHDLVQVHALEALAVATVNAIEAGLGSG